MDSVRRSVRSVDRSKFPWFEFQEVLLFLNFCAAPLSFVLPPLSPHTLKPTLKIEDKDIFIVWGIYSGLWGLGDAVGRRRGGDVFYGSS